MNVQKALAVGAMSISVANFAFAESWVYIGYDSGNSRYFIDADSVSNEAAGIEFWGKIDASSDETVKYREKKTFVRIDCIKKRLGVVYSITYYPNGQSDFYGPHDYVTLAPIAPGTMGEAMREYICGT